MHWLPFPHNSYTDFLHLVETGYLNPHAPIGANIISANMPEPEMKNRSRSFQVMENEGLINKVKFEKSTWVWTGIGRAIALCIQREFKPKKPFIDPDDDSAAIVSMYPDEKGIWFENLLEAMPSKMRNKLLQLPWSLFSLGTTKMPRWMKTLLHLKVIRVVSYSTHMIALVPQNISVIEFFKENPRHLPKESEFPPTNRTRRSKAADELRETILEMRRQYDISLNLIDEWDII